MMSGRSTERTKTGVSATNGTPRGRRVAAWPLLVGLLLVLLGACGAPGAIDTEVPTGPDPQPQPQPSIDYVTLAQSLDAVLIHANGGGEAWLDESGNGFDGRPVDGPVWSETGGPGENVAGFYRLDGRTQRIEIGDAEKLRVQEHALVWWERTEDGQRDDYATVISKGDLSFHVRAGTVARGSDDRVGVLRGAVETDVFGTEIAPGGWQMLMLRWTGEAHELWTIGEDGTAIRVDGTLRTAPIDHSDAILAYGAQDHYSEGWRRYWRGDLAGVLLFDHSISIEDMQALHAVALKTAPVAPPNPGDPPPSDPPPADPPPSDPPPSDPPPSDPPPSDPPPSNPPPSDPPPSNPPPSDPPPPNPSYGDEFFVAPWGSDGGVGSWGDPFSSLRPVAEVARPGDVVWLRGGVYDDYGGGQVYYDVSLSGEEGAPITVRSYPGEMAVFDGRRHPWYPRTAGDGREVNDPALLLIVGDHLVIEDLTFRNGVGNGFHFVGYHNVVRRVTSHDHHGHGVRFQGSYNLLEYVTSFGNDSVANGGNSADGISFMDGAYIRRVKGSDAETRGNVVRYSLTYRNSDDGIDTWNALDSLIEYNLSFENGYGPTGNGEGFKLGGDHRPDLGTLVRFNIAFANRKGFSTNGSTGVTLMHNTSWAVRGENIGFTLTDHATDADENAAYNNVSFEDYWPRARGDGTDHRFNTWNLGIDDPDFRSFDLASSDFLTLRPGSPAVNAGMRVGLPYTGSAPDLGALQLGDRVILARAPDGSWRLQAWETAAP